MTYRQAHRPVWCRWFSLSRCVKLTTKTNHSSVLFKASAQHPLKLECKVFKRVSVWFLFKFYFFHIFGLALHYISDKATFSLIGLWQVIAILRKKWKLVFIYICFLSLGLLQAQFIWSFLSGLDFRISYYHLNAEKKKLFLRNILVNTLIKESITLEWKTILISIHQVCFKQWRPVCVGMG